MINVGVVGLGMMGSTHLDVYAKREDVRLVAISDTNPRRLNGEEVTGGNIEGQARGGLDLSHAKRYSEGEQLIADPYVQLVDICLPTPMHRQYVEAALAAGKHVLVEKPLSRTYIDAKATADAAANAQGLSMCAMCMRFWPGWTLLKQTIEEKPYGKVLGAHFRRLTSHAGGAFYSDGDACGGAILDLHIHDTDFVQHCFGLPKSVFSRGYSKITSQIDHVFTQYLYDGGPMVTAEGGWAMADGFGFQMHYTVNFERATVEFSFNGKNHMRLCEPGKPARKVEVSAGLGYDHVVAYFLDCVKNNQRPTIITLAQAADSVRIVEAELKSIVTGNIINL